MLGSQKAQSRTTTSLLLSKVRKLVLVMNTIDPILGNDTKRNSKIVSDGRVQEQFRVMLTQV